MGNGIGGSIPTSIGLLSNLETLDISDNLFEGTIPTELGNLRNIVEVKINDNKLEGEVPRELAKLNYTKLSLQNNNLHGNMTFLCTKDFNDSGDVGAGFLVEVTADCNEEVECLCCTECF